MQIYLLHWSGDKLIPQLYGQMYFYIQHGKNKNQFVWPVAADFVVKHQMWATGAEEPTAEARKGCEGIYGSMVSLRAMPLSCSIFFSYSTENGISLDLGVPRAGQVYRLLPKFILCTSVCRNHCDSREKYCYWAAVILPSQPLSCEYRLFPI